MALLDPILLRGVLETPGDPPDAVHANLTALRGDVVADGTEAHLLAFLGDLTDRTGVVPPVTLVEQHYHQLAQRGDPYGHAGLVLLAGVLAQGLPFPAVPDYRYALDQFRDRVLGDGLGILLQEVGLILTSGLNHHPKKGVPPVVLQGPTAAVSFIEQRLAQVTAQFRGSGVEGSLRDAASVYARYQQRLGQPTAGVLSGWSEIDTVHDGLQPGDLALLLGFTSQMKSTAVLNWAYHAVVWYGKTVAYVPLENSVRAVQDSLVVMHCTHPKFVGSGLVSITYDRLRRGQLTAAEEDIVKAAIDDLATNPAYGQFLYKDPDKADVTVGEIFQWAEQKDKTHPLDLLVIDYLGLVNPSSGGVAMKESAIANVTVRETKKRATSFARGRGLAVLSPWAANREGFKDAEKNGGQYSLRAMSWAPEAEKSSDFVYYVYRDATMAEAKTLQMGNLKARDRRQITTPITVYADGDLRVIEDFDLSKAHQNPIPSLGTAATV